MSRRGAMRKVIAFIEIGIDESERAQRFVARLECGHEGARRMTRAEVDRSGWRHLVVGEQSNILGWRGHIWRWVGPPTRQHCTKCGAEVRP